MFKRENDGGGDAIESRWWGLDQTLWVHYRLFISDVLALTEVPQSHSMRIKLGSIYRHRSFLVFFMKS
jgi:hypothetical protein